MGGAFSVFCLYLRRLRVAKGSLADSPKDSSSVGLPTTAEQRAFLDAARWCNFAKVLELAHSQPSLVNVQLPGRWTALHYAASHGDERAVQFLLERGASTTAVNLEGWTPLEVAHPGVFELLLAATISAVEEKTAVKVPRTSDEALSCLRVRKFSELSELSTSVGVEAVCQICLEDLRESDEVRSLPCDHFFHTGCVDQWLREKSNSCPSCRREIS